MNLVGCIIRVWNTVNNSSLSVVLRKEMTSKIIQTVRLASIATKASKRANPGLSHNLCTSIHNMKRNNSTRIQAKATSACVCQTTQTSMFQ